METVEHIKETYRFLLEEGYTLTEYHPQTEGRPTSMVYTPHDASGVIFEFMVDRGSISLAVTTEAILTHAAYGPYDKYYDFFYLVKLLEPARSYADIHPAQYAECLKRHFGRLVALFGSAQVQSTLTRLAQIMHQYNQWRWNG